MIQESTDDILAKLRHALNQRERAAREWERQAKQWEERWRAVTGERDQARAELSDLRQTAQSLIHEARNPVHDHWNDWVARLRARADELAGRAAPLASAALTGAAGEGKK